MNGIVKFWSEPRGEQTGWGIITPHGVKRGDRLREVFFHEDDLHENSPRPSKGSKGVVVEFSIIPGSATKESGPRALTVMLLGKQSYVPINEGRSQQRKAVASGD